MSKKAFDKIAAGLEEALSVARGEIKPFKLHVPVEMNVRSIRALTDMSRDEFAASFGFTPNQIRDWEQGINRPIGAMRAYLMLIENNHQTMLKLLNEARAKAA
jgi:putative transcriptional regulator